MNSYNSYRFISGAYNWLNSSDERVQVIFRLRDKNPFEKPQVSFVVWEVGSDWDTEDFDTVYDVAVHCQEYLNNKSSLVNSDKEKINKLVDYLFQNLYSDKIEALLEEKKKLIIRMGNIDKRIISVEQEMDEATAHE